MRCPACGKSTPDHSVHCLHCGAPVGSRAGGSAGPVDWEYDDFVYALPKGGWCKLGSGAYSEAGAKLEFWQNCQRDIYAKLQEWQDDGWEPVGTVDSGCVEIRTATDHRDKGCGYWLLIAICSIPTYGILLLLFLIFGRSTFAEPVRAVVPMRRAQQIGAQSVPAFSAPSILPSLPEPRLYAPSQVTRLCPRCAHANRTGAKFCARCSQSL